MLHLLVTKNVNSLKCLQSLLVFCQFENVTWQRVSKKVNFCDIILKVFVDDVCSKLVYLVNSVGR